MDIFYFLCQCSTWYVTLKALMPYDHIYTCRQQLYVLPYSLNLCLCLSCNLCLCEIIMVDRFLRFYNNSIFNVGINKVKGNNETSLYNTEHSFK